MLSAYAARERQLFMRSWHSGGL